MVVVVVVEVDVGGGGVGGALVVIGTVLQQLLQPGVVPQKSALSLHPPRAAPAWQRY